MTIAYEVFIGKKPTIWIVTDETLTVADGSWRTP